MDASSSSASSDNEKCWKRTSSSSDHDEESRSPRPSPAWPSEKVKEEARANKKRNRRGRRGGKSRHTRGLAPRSPLDTLKRALAARGGLRLSPGTMRGFDLFGQEVEPNDVRACVVLQCTMRGSFLEASFAPTLPGAFPRRTILLR